jgi:hypothetical protein
MMTAEEWLKVLLSSSVVAALLVGIFGVVTLKLGLKRFRSERWWEKKAAAYASVIEGMHAMYDGAKAWADEANSEYELSEEWNAALREANMKGWAEIRKGASIGSFIMSKNAASILSKLVRELDAQDDKLPTHDFHSVRRNILSDAILQMTVEAKNDLGT